MHVTIEAINPPEEDEKAFERGLVEGLREAPMVWQRDMVRHHFEPSAPGRYGYARRTPQYERRKWKVKHHKTPLIWTGESRRMIVGRRARPQVKKVPTGREARLVIHAPDYFYKYRPGQPDKAAEVVSTTDAEREQLQEVVARQIDAALARANARKMKRL